MSIELQYDPCGEVLKYKAKTAESAHKVFY